MASNLFYTILFSQITDVKKLHEKKIKSRMSKKLGREVAEATERWEGGREQGSGMASRGGAEHSKAGVRQGHSV